MISTIEITHIAAKITRRSGQEAKKYFGLDSLQSIIFPFTNVKLVKKHLLTHVCK